MFEHRSTSNLGYLLTMVSRAWNRRLMKAFEEEGYDDQKPSYGAIFIPLFHKDGLAITEIIELSQISKQTASTYIKELSEKGYIEIRDHPEDRRFSLVYLTPKGKLLRKTADRVVSRVNREFLQTLRRDEGELLLSVLRRWIEKEAGVT